MTLYRKKPKQVDAIEWKCNYREVRCNYREVIVWWRSHDLPMDEIYGPPLYVTLNRKLGIVVGVTPGEFLVFEDGQIAIYNGAHFLEEYEEMPGVSLESRKALPGSVRPSRGLPRPREVHR